VHSWVVDSVWRLNAVGWYHLVVFGAVIPYLAFRSSRHLANPNLPPLDRMRHFRTTAAMLLLFAAFSLMTAWRLGLNLFPPLTRETALAIPVALALLVVSVVAMRPMWRRAVIKRKRVVHLFMPANATERAWWIAVALLAGISEEITWRGVQIALLVPLVKSAFVAMLVTSILFGLAHMTQGWKSSGLIALFATAFHSLVWLSGSLYVAMFVHAAYDVIAGITYGRLGRELGYELPGPGTTGTAGSEGTTDLSK